MKSAIVLVVLFLILCLGIMTILFPNQKDDISSVKQWDNNKRVGIMKKPFRNITDKEVVLLIDKLTLVDKIPIPGKVFDWPALPIPHCLEEIIRRGHVALPQLIDDLRDERETKLSFDCVKGENWVMGIFFSYGYDKRFKMSPEIIPKRPIINDTFSYTVRVGDLCYFAIGEIVNRRLYPFWHRPTNCVVINSPLVFPEVAEAVAKEWKGITRDDFRKSLIEDLGEPERREGAIRRLWLYFPEEAKAYVEENRKLFNEFQLAPN